MDVVGVMAAYCNPMCVCMCVCVRVRVCVVHYLERHTQTHRVTICCHKTDYVHVNGQDRTITLILAKHCTRLTDDGSSVIRNMLEYF